MHLHAGKAGLLVAYLGGWSVTAHSHNCALITVPCGHGWVGRCLMHIAVPMVLSGTATLARGGRNIRYVGTTCQAAATGPALVAAMYAFVHKSFAHVCIARAYPPTPVYESSAGDLVCTAALLATLPDMPPASVSQATATDWVVVPWNGVDVTVRVLTDGISVLTGATERRITVGPSAKLHVRHVPFVVGVPIGATLLEWLTRALRVLPQTRLP